MRVIELFAGIGAQHAALTRLGMDAEYTVCEIDENAYRAYQAVHGPTPNLGDIRDVERLPPSDLVTWSFPCTSISAAGRREGMREGSGTASSLGWEVIRVLRATPERERPRHLLMENVPMLLNAKNRPEFDRMCAELASMGYVNTHATLNACDYGVPQHRRRVFMVSSLDGPYTFPAPVPLTRCLRDVMEEDVDSSYFLSSKVVEGYERHKARQEENGRGFGWRPSGPEVVARCVTPDPTRHCSTFIRYTGDTHKESTFESNRRVVSSEGVSPTLTLRQDEGQCTKIETAPRGDVARVEIDGEEVSIRRLTERECWRLMGFSDAEFERARDAGIPKTHLYKQAGNSIVVDVLVAIFRNLYAPDATQTRLEGFFEEVSE